MKLLWLASWYPNRTSPYNGDFILRHARAVAPLVEQLTVLAVIKDEAMPPGTVETVREQQENLERILVYYGPSRRWPEKPASLFRSWQLQRRIYKEWCSRNGPPALLHVHVPVKAGLLALYCRYFQRIPYIVTEHWAGYDAASRPGLRDMGRWFRLLNARIFRKAAVVTAVSRSLALALERQYRITTVRVIPNVVDTRIFFPSPPTPAETIRLIHVSGMDYQKNAEDMLRALALWKGRGGCFEMDCFGRAPASLIRLAKQLELNEELRFHGEAPQPVIADAMRRADALVLYSRFETFGCVLIEAHASGIPVIVSDLPVFHEIVTAGFNGLFAGGENPEALAAAFEIFRDTRSQFNREQIAARAAAQYGYRTVGRHILDVYKAAFQGQT